MKRMISRFRDERGAGMTTMTLLLVGVLFLLLGIVVDAGNMYVVKVRTVYALEDGLMAAVNQVDLKRLAHGQVVIDQGRAQQAFLSQFSSSAGLYMSGTPMPGNTLYGGRVILQDFEVYNRYPTYGPHSVYIDRPTVYASVTIPVRLLIFWFLQPTVDVPVWASFGANRQGG